MTYLELSQLSPNSTLDVLELHNSQINTDTPGHILLEMFHKCSRNPGVIVSNGEDIVAIISRKLFLEHMSHAYSLELYLRRPIQLYLNVFKTYFFQLPSICTIEQAVKLALSRPVNLVYEPIVVINEEQKVSLLDIYVLLLAQSQVLLKTNTLIQQQQQQKQVYLELLERQQAELQQSKEELIESEERYHRLVEFSPETIAVHKEGKFEYINVAGAKLLGAANPDELIGKSIWNFVCPSEREMVKVRVQLLQAKEDYAELIEGKFLRLDGQAIDVEV